MYKWFKKWCEVNIYPDVLEIKNFLKNDKFLTLLHPTNGWKNGKYRMALQKKE